MVLVHLFLPHKKSLKNVKRSTSRMFYRCKLRLSLVNMFFDKQSFGEYHWISPTVIRGKKLCQRCLITTEKKRNTRRLRDSSEDIAQRLSFLPLWPWPFLIFLTQSLSATFFCWWRWEILPHYPRRSIHAGPLKVMLITWLLAEWYGWGSWRCNQYFMHLLLFFSIENFTAEVSVS